MPRFAEGSGELIPEPVLLSHLDFIGRFPPATLTVLHALTRSTDENLAASVMATLYEFQVATGIDPADPRTVLNSQAVAQLLAYVGHIGPDDIAAVVAAATAPV